MSRSVRIAICVVAAIATSGISAGCAASSGSGRETATVGEEMVEVPTAEFVGVLDSDDDGEVVYFTAEVDDGNEVGLILPHGFSSSEEGDQILDEAGNVVAVVGEQYGFSGGEYALGGDVWAGGPVVDSLWLTGTISDRE